MRFVELSSVAILALYLAMQHRRGQLRAFAWEAACIALAGWLAEDLCIHLYRFYAYAPGWTLTLDVVPLMVAVIWPFVVLSARDVARALSVPPAWEPWVAAGVVLYDASLIEPVAVRAGLWSWAEPGLWGVPFIGVWGWGVFAVLALLACSRGRPWAVPLAAPALANALLCLSWWCCFRWGMRTELPAAARLAASVLIGLALLWAVRGKRGAASMEVMAPRAAAAGLFFALVALHGDAALWAYVAPFALPYLWLTRWPARQPAPATARP